MLGRTVDGNDEKERQMAITTRLPVKELRLRWFFLFVVIICFLAGCAMTGKQLEHLYYQKPLHKALVNGNRFRDFRKIAAASWNAGTVEAAKIQALGRCRAVAYNCEVVNVDGNAYPYIIKNINNQNNDNPTDSNDHQDESSRIEPQWPKGTTVIARFGYELQSEPGFSGNILDAMIPGEKFTVLDISRDHNWRKIKSKSSDKVGWAAIKWLEGQEDVRKDGCKYGKYNHPEYWISHNDQVKKHIKNCWNIYQQLSIEQLLYRYTRSLPAKKVKENRQAYKTLLIFSPSDKIYRKKYKYYCLPEKERKKFEADKQKMTAEKAEAKRRLAEKRKKSKIKRLYRSSDEFWNVVVTPAYKTRIKCALYDAGGNILAVDEQIVEPPFDEVLIRVPGAAADMVDYVKCSGLQ